MMSSPDVQPRYRSVPFTRRPLGSNTEMIVSDVLQRGEPVTLCEAACLAACTSFQTLEEHARRIAQEESPLDAPETLSMLCTLAARGWLISDNQLRCAIEAFPEEEQSPLEWLAIPTRGRPQGVIDAIQSYAANADRNGRTMRVVVADGSPEEGACAEMRDRLRVVARQCNISAHYAGIQEKRTFIKRLAKTGDLPEALLTFALLGDDPSAEAIGANRNAVALQTVGERVLSVDDDTRCVPRSAPVTSCSQAALVGDVDPTELWFGADRASVFDATEPLTLDVLGGHASFLGRTVCRPGVAGANRRRRVSGAEIDVTRACVHQLKNVAAREAHIAVTVNGLVGDSAMYSGERLGLLEGPSRQRVVASESAHRIARESREVIRQAVRPAITHLGPIMSTMIAFDNRRILPPFMPMYRSEDTVFARMLAMCDGSAYVCHLPWTMLHMPDGDRKYEADASCTTRVSSFVLALLEPLTFVLVNQTPERRLRELGERLMDLANLPAAEFWQMACDYVRSNAFALIDAKEALVRKYGFAPHYWARELLRQVRTTIEAIASRRLYVPKDMCQQGSNPPGAIRDYVRKLGMLTNRWPDIVESTSVLKRQGTMLAPDVNG